MPTQITAATFALQPGETLWRLDTGELVTVRVARGEAPDDATVVLITTGRRLADDGADLGDDLPRAPHTFSHDAFAPDHPAPIDPQREIDRVTEFALAQWAHRIRAHAAFAHLPLYQVDD